MSKGKNFIRFPRSEPAKVTPLEVKVEGSVEEAIRRFKALYQRERIVAEYKERMYYEKPSERKRRKQREARERRLMEEARERMMATGEWDARKRRKEQKLQSRLEAKLRSQEKREDLF